MLKPVDGHSELLEDALANLVVYGSVSISDWHLLRWTNSKRVAPRTWKYVHQLFDEIIEKMNEHKHGYKLFVGESSETYTLLIWDRGIGGEGSVADPWWVSIDDLEKPRRRVKAGKADDDDTEEEPATAE